MQDEELIAQSPMVPTMYFDGFGGYKKINGVLRCVGWVFHGGAQLNLVVSLSGADDANRATRRTLDQTHSFAIWHGGAGMAH